MRIGKRVLCLLFITALTSGRASAQCTITNATSCVCPPGSGSSDCDLLPDLTISWYGLENYAGGPTEYPQTGAGADNGHLRVTGSTPNIGYGPFSVQAEQNAEHWFVCGTDTFTAPASQTFTCPNGEVAKQLLWQRVYHKSGNQMTFRDRVAGAMTYQQGSMHVDDWGRMSLRIQDPLEPDPLKWSVIGWGHKQSFCLMDYGSCSTYQGHCRDDQSVFGQGTVLLNADFPNYGLGNSYGCSDVEQGCSVGYTDIYSESLNGMFIEIPPGTCNGDYWIVYELDPHDFFVEMNESNNFTIMPFTLTQQDAPGNPVARISADRSTLICGTDSITLTANAGLSYVWSTGATTQSIRVSAGSYSVAVTTYCGTATSDPVTITSMAAPLPPVVMDDTVCSGTSAILSAVGNDILWLDAAGQVAGTGNLLTTPSLTASTYYQAIQHLHHPGVISHGAKPDNTGGGSYFTGTQYLIFDALKPFLLKSALFYANGDGPRTIFLSDATGNTIQSVTVNIQDGMSREDLGIEVPVGTNLRLGVSGTPNLYRNNAGVTYPYVLQDTLSITGSSAGASYYYFLYDWEIEVGGITCESQPALSQVFVETCTGIGGGLEEKFKLTISPNPSDGVFQIRVNGRSTLGEMSMNVFDLAGRLLFSRVVQSGSNEWTHTLDLVGLPAGTYLFTLETNEGRLHRRVIVR